MSTILEQFVAILLDLMEMFQIAVRDIPIIDFVCVWTPLQCLVVFGVLSLALVILLLIVAIVLTVQLPANMRKRAVCKFFSIDDLSRFTVKKMGKAGSKYYYSEGVNTFTLTLPKWKYTDAYGNKEPHRLFNKVVYGESILWLHARNKVYVLSTKDPWEMTYLVHTLRELSIDILACKQEMEKQESIERTKPTPDEFIQGLIARMDDEAAFTELCRERLEAQGMQVMDAPKNKQGINFFAKKGKNPCLVKCMFVPYRHLSSLEELKEFREAADDLFTSSCILITTGHITIAAAGYAKEHNIELIHSEQLMKLMDESERLDTQKAYLQWELSTRDLNALMPEDLVAKILS